MALDADVIVVGAGLAGLVATAELADAGRRVILLDQEPEASLGGQAFWSFGGLFLVDSPEQRRLRVRDSRELALMDWLGAAGFDRDDDAWPRRWAEAYVDFAAGEKRAWLHEQGVRWFPFVQWAERGGYGAIGHGNSVPRFHITWGTGPGIIEPFVRRVRAAEARGAVTLRFRHRVTGLTSSSGSFDGVAGEVLAPSSVERGASSARDVAGEFDLRAQAVVVTAGGIGGDHDLVRRNWPERLGQPPPDMLSGVPDHVDGRMLEAVSTAGARVIGADRMWNYPEGVHNPASIWPPPRDPDPLRSLAAVARRRGPAAPGAAVAGLRRARRGRAHRAGRGTAHSWFVLNERILATRVRALGLRAEP